MKPLLFLFLIFISAVLCAQEPQPTPPLPPLLKKAPIPSQWIITYKTGPTESSSATAASSAIQEKTATARSKMVTVVRTQDGILERTVNESGAVTDIWRTSGYVIMGVGGKDWAVCPGGGGTSFNYTDYSTNDFAGFDWITVANFTGVQDVAGRKCLAFKAKIVALDPGELQSIRSDTTRALAEWEAANSDKPDKNKPPVPSPTPFDINNYKVEVTAYIDDESRLPVALVYPGMNGLMSRLYQFQAAPASLSTPPEVQKLLETHKRWQQRMSNK